MEPKLKLADEVWVATALLHRDQPECSAFPGSKILRRAKQLHPSTPPRAGLNPRIYGHCVANAKPVSGRYRMLYREQGGSYRLFRDGDDFHPNRPRGRTTPDGESLPSEYRHLLEWYDSEYNKQSPLRPEDDPILALEGVGSEVWRSLGGGDAFIKWLRSDEVIPAPWEKQSDRSAAAKHKKASKPGRASAVAKKQNDFREVWERIRRSQGQGFRTVRGLDFTYRLENDSVLRILRKHHEINRNIPRGDVEKAWSRRPLAGPKDLHRLQGSSYLFGIVTDRRIVQ